MILSSSPVPGNEKAVYKNIDMLYEAGAKVIYSRLAAVHVHGHAAREELKIIHRLVQPRHFVPIHGEYRHLVLHRELAISLGMPPEDAFVLTDGDVLEIDDDGARLGEKVEADYIYIDGLGIGEIDDFVLRDRQHLANDGLVVFVTDLHPDQTLVRDGFDAIFDKIDDHLPYFELVQVEWSKIPILLELHPDPLPLCC